MAMRVWIVAAIALTFGSWSCSKSEDRPPAAPNVVVESASSQPAADEPLVAEPGTSVITLAVERMHCSGCAEAITDKVQQLEGVRRVRVSLAKRTAWVMVDDASRPKPGRIVEAIESLGYKARPAEGPTSRSSSAPA